MIYIILAHQDPEHLRKLVGKLQDNVRDNYFIIHIDLNHDIVNFEKLLGDVKHCYFTPKRYSSNWGSFGLVEATLHALEYIQKTLRKRQRIVLLSGTDYPIKNNLYIRRYLGSKKDVIFIEYQAIPRKIWHQGGIARFPLYDEFKQQINFFGGSQWFSIPPKAVTIIFNFLKANADFMEYFKYVSIPDESFFQTLFLNCDHPYINENLRNQNLHYIKWDKPYIHPRILTISDYQRIKKSKNLFARKFDSIYSLDLQKSLDDKHPHTADQAKSKKTAILFLTDSGEPAAKKMYNKLKQEVITADVYKIVTEKSAFEPAIDTVFYEHNYHKQLGYTPLNEHKIIPGCTYFAILYFKTLYQEYDYYWLIEDDVWFNGNWNEFFGKFKSNNADLISSYFTTYSEFPNWYWWEALTTQEVIPNEYKMRTFYPICRFSSKALQHLDEKLRMGNYGHGEVLVPTLLYLNGMSFYDLAYDQKLMIPSTDKAVGDHNNGSFRYRPVINRAEIIGEYLFHPVKGDYQETNT